MKNPRTHFMGVGGSGCSAAFALAHHNGFRVNGCDLEKESPYLETNLAKKVKIGHSRDHLKDMDLLVYSPAIVLSDQENEEWVAAKRKNIRVLPWEKFLSESILPGKFLIAVSGTHGKGTTTAMIATLLEKAGLDPTCLIGAKVNAWGRNYRVGKSKYFVLEADEYRERFLVYRPDVAVITNIGYDHPDYFENEESVRNTFLKFVGNLKLGSILVTGPGVDLENAGGETKFFDHVEDLNLKLPGTYNKVNASLAAITARALNIGEETIRSSLENFSGLARRFEFKGEEKGVKVFDDYAVHPKEVSETIKAAREKFPKNNLWLVFQPHTFSRLKTFFNDFVSVFEESSLDELVFLDVFGAREKGYGLVSSADLAKVLKKKKAKYLQSLEEASAYIVSNSGAGDVIIAMGAGDIYKLSDVVLKKLANKS